MSFHRFTRLQRRLLRRSKISLIDPLPSVDGHHSNRRPMRAVKWLSCLSPDPASRFPLVVACGLAWSLSGAPALSFAYDQVVKASNRMTPMESRNETSTTATGPTAISGIAVASMTGVQKLRQLFDIVLSQTKAIGRMAQRFAR